jgi:hypothetical protein
MQQHSGKLRLSHSALDVYHTCERMFQLDRLLVGAPIKQDYPATVFGTAFGTGVASYLTTQNIDKAIFDLYMAYWTVQEDDKRTEEICINMLLNAIPHLDNLLQDYEVAYFIDKNGNEIPATELSFCLDINEKFYYVGYIDVVLRNKWTGKYAIMENKSTGLNLHDLSCLYQNSGQALGYSIVIDAVAGEENADYEVLYFVGQLGSGNGFTPKIHTLPFPKTLSDRLNWFISLKLDVDNIENMLDINVFPMRGKSCLQYMRPCKHFGTCSLHGLDEYLPPLEDNIDYMFTYNLDEVISNHLERI